MSVQKSGVFESIEYRIVIGPIGAYCAYVRIPDDHPFMVYAGTKKNIRNHEIDVSYDSIDIGCHGGLTFSATIGIGEKTVQEFSPGFWVGWDYSHAGDFVPGLPSNSIWGDRVYSLEIVEEEVKGVIRQVNRLAIKQD